MNSFREWMERYSREISLLTHPTPNFTRLKALRLEAISHVLETKFSTHFYKDMFSYYLTPIVARKNNMPWKEEYGHIVCDFITHWAETYDPRLKSDTDSPFILFPVQRQLVSFIFEAFFNNEPCAVLKSRAVGASWCMAGVVLYLMLFQENFKALVVADKLETANTKLMDMVRFLFLTIASSRVFCPQAMFNFEKKSGDNLSKQSYVFGKDKDGLQLSSEGFLRNPSMNSELIGSGGDNAGRGGRYSMVWLDEAAHIQNSHNLVASLAPTNKCMVHISTPRGKNNNFCDIVESGSVKSIKVHISQIPLYTEKDIELMKAQFGSNEALKRQEFDCSFEGSTEGLFLPSDELSRAFKRYGTVRANEYIGTMYGIDPAGNSPNSIDLTVITARQGDVVHPQLQLFKADPEEIMRAMQFMVSKYGEPEAIGVDSVGLGEGIAWSFEKRWGMFRQGGRVYRVKANNSVSDETVKDMNALMWKRLRAWLVQDDCAISDQMWVKSGSNFVLERSNVLKNQMLSILHDYRNDKLRIVYPDGKSPDHADSLANTFCVDSQQMEIFQKRQSSFMPPCNIKTYWG